MAYWTVSGDPRNDAARGRETRKWVAAQLDGWGAVKEEARAKFRHLRDEHLADLGSRAKRRRVRQAIKDWQDLCEQERQMRAFMDRHDYA